MSSDERRSRRFVALVFVCAPMGYVACSTFMSPSAGSPGVDGGSGDGAGPSREDRDLPFDADLIPVPGDAAPGAPCTASTGCALGLDCLYPIADECTAQALCAPFAPFDGSPCGGPYCTCAGDTTGVCGGYGYAPMQYPLHGPPCTAETVDSGSADAPASDDAGRDAL